MFLGNPRSVTFIAAAFARQSVTLTGHAETYRNDNCRGFSMVTLLSRDQIPMNRYPNRMTQTLHYWCQRCIDMSNKMESHLCLSRKRKLWPVAIPGIGGRTNARKLCMDNNVRYPGKNL